MRCDGNPNVVVPQEAFEVFDGAALFLQLPGVVKSVLPPTKFRGIDTFCNSDFHGFLEFFGTSK